jgi:hypothetical protein
LKQNYKKKLPAKITILLKIYICQKGCFFISFDRKTRKSETVNLRPVSKIQIANPYLLAALPAIGIMEINIKEAMPGLYC